MNKFWKIVGAFLFHTVGQIFAVPALLLFGFWLHKIGFNATSVLIFMGAGIAIVLISVFLRIAKDKKQIGKRTQSAEYLMHEQTEEERLARQKRNAERCQYLEGVMDDLLKENPDKFLEDISARIMLAAKDIYGENSKVVEYFEGILLAGRPERDEFAPISFEDGISLIEARNAVRLAETISSELLQIHQKNLVYFEENLLYFLWEDFEHAGMSHEDIGKYYERFKK